MNIRARDRPADEKRGRQNGTFAIRPHRELRQEPEFGRASIVALRCPAQGDHPFRRKATTSHSHAAGSAFAEAYHIGVVGLLRVAWGYRHTHELAMEAM